MNGKFTGLSIYMEALEKAENDKMSKGANAGDIHQFLCYVQQKNLDGGRNIDFTWRRLCGFDSKTNRAKKQWHVSDLVNVNLKRSGIYVLLGKSKRNSVKYVKFLTKLNNAKTEELKLQMWGSVAKGECVTMDHAISLVVKGDGQKILYDNGFRDNQKEFSIGAIAGRMEDIKLCYVLDLHEVV